MKTYCVANYKGDLIGHDMTLTSAELLQQQMAEKEPDQEWEVISQ